MRLAVSRVTRMASVVVSAVRFRSMLANRNKGLSQALNDLNTRVDLGVLHDVDTEVDFDDLLLLARYFKRPWPYLLLDDAESFPDLGQDHRTHYNQLAYASAELITELEASMLILSAASELFPEGGYQVPRDGMTTSIPPGDIGAEVRTFLGVSANEQLSTSDEYAALRLWVGALEARGVYVSQRRLDDPTIRAFSKTDLGQALIVVDTGDSPYARSFSLLHEYCHIILRSTGICDLDQHDAVERYCNRVAAAALMPMELLSKEIGVWHFGLDDEEDDVRLRRLSDRFRVSQAALLIRLQEASWISERSYDAMELRRSRRRAPERTPGGQFYPVAINRAGRRFSRNVFGVLDEGAIDRADAAGLLGIGEHLIPRYRRELFGGHGDAG